MVAVLFPGRHHVLTKFQYSYLRNLIDKGVNGKKITKIIFAVTLADHANTRRNPVPLYLRVLAIEKFSRDLPVEIKIYPIDDIEQTSKFAKYMLKRILFLEGEIITNKNTMVACSTPSVINLFKKLRFKNLPVELINERKNKYCELRPYEVIDLLVKAGKWREDNQWKKYASQATQDVFLEYNLGDSIIELFRNSLLSEDANITETRNYNSYARGMDNAIEFKFKDIKPFIIEGKIVDVGCGTGALVNLLAKKFQESDIIGVEATRKFYEYCKLQDYPNPFVYFYRRNILNQNFKEDSINSFVYSSILHEIYSYIGVAALRKALRNTFTQLAPKGRIIIRDVVGPNQKKKKVYMKLNEKDGKEKGKIDQLSTYSKFFRFTKDFKPRKIKFKKKKIDGHNFVLLNLQDAYEYFSKMSYTDNWESEMREEFGFWNFSEWCKELKQIGFKKVEGSRSFSNPHIVERKYKGKVSLFEKKGNKLINFDYPPTNMILVGEKVGLLYNS